MKRALFAMIALSLAFVFACHPNENGNGNGNKSSNSNQSAGPPTPLTDKIVQIFVSDDPARPGHYEIDDPGSVTLHKKKSQKISWCVIYDGKTPPGVVIIDNFKSPASPSAPAALNPFGDGSPGDNTFTIPSADFNVCKYGTKTPKMTADLRNYKYTITVKVASEVRGRLDPVVVIDN